MISRNNFKLCQRILEAAPIYNLITNNLCLIWACLQKLNFRGMKPTERVPKAWTCNTVNKQNCNNFVYLHLNCLCGHKLVSITNTTFKTQLFCPLHLRFPIKPWIFSEAVFCFHHKPIPIFPCPTSDTQQLCRTHCRKAFLVHAAIWAQHWDTFLRPLELTASSEKVNSYSFICLMIMG